MADIVSGLSALKTAFEIAKELKNATKAYNDAEVRLKISDLYSALSDARVDLADAQVEISELRSEVRELNAKLKAVDEVVYKDGFFYREKEVDGKPNGPYCPTCYQGHSKSLVIVQPATGIHREFGSMYCHVCKSHF